MESWMEKASDYLIIYGTNIVLALLILLIGKWVAQLLSKFAYQAMQKSKIKETLAVFTRNIVYYALLVFVAIAALGKIGVQTNSFVAVIGAAGLAVGLALQGSLSNFAAGVMLILFEPFQLNDYVEAGGVTGTVKEIQIFSTIMTTDDNKKVIIPNSKITGDKIVIFPKK